MPDSLFETFLTSRGLNGLCKKECHISVKNWILDGLFHKKNSIDFFSASDDQTIRIRKFFWEIGL